LTNGYRGILTLIILLSGCSSQKFVLDTSKTSFVDVLNNIEIQQNALTSFVASSRISVDTPEFSGNFFADILYLEPDSILISATGPFGVHAGKLFIGKSRFIFFNQIDNRFYNGSVADFKERNFFQFPLKLSEFMYIFAAKEVLSALKIDAYLIKDDSFFISGRRGEIQYDIWIDQYSGRINKVVAKQAEETIIIREYGDFMKIDGLYFPKKITMLRPAENQSVAIYYSRISLNEPLDKSRFNINISDRAEQIDISIYDGK